MRAFLGKIWWRGVRFGFRLLYNEMAWTYDGVAWMVSLGQWRNWQRTALKHLPSSEGIILELAHGTGNLQIDLHTAGYQSIGLDLSRAMGTIARRKLKRHHIVPRLVRGRGQVLPFPDQCFNAVVTTFPTPFIFEQETLKEIHRVLKPKGQLIIVLNGLITSKDIISRTLEFAYRITGQRSDDSTADATLEEHFHSIGFHIELINEPCKRSIAQLIIATPIKEQTPVYR